MFTYNLNDSKIASTNYCLLSIDSIDNIQLFCIMKFKIIKKSLLIGKVQNSVITINLNLKTF